jgi:hypothetical protein
MLYKNTRSDSCSLCTQYRRAKGYKSSIMGLEQYTLIIIPPTFWANAEIDYICGVDVWHI